MRATIGCALAMLIAVVTAPQAQRGGATPQPVFRSGTQMVLVNAIVTDDRDRVVTDLTRDEFVITEKGRPQRITEFSFESIPPADRPIDLDKPTRPPSDVAFNAQTTARSRAFVILIDESTIPTSEIVPFKRLMTALLGTLAPDDQVAVIYMGRSDLGTDFTNDIERAIDVVNRRRAAFASAAPVDGRSRMINFRNVVKTLQASRHARRAVFLVSAGGCVPIGPNGDECRDLIKRAQEADVPFYVLDPRLFANGDITSAVAPAPLRSAGDLGTTERDEIMTLAGQTGGRAMSRAGDPPKAAAALVAENGSYYLLGFHPDPFVSDGKFHEIKVTVTRPGLRVRARMGYLTPEPSTRPSTPTRDMTATLGAGLDDPGLPIRVFAAPIGPAPNGKTRTLVTMEITYPRSTGDAAFEEDLRVGIIALTPDAKIKASFQRPIHLAGKWLPVDSATFVVNEVIDLPSDTLALRAGVTSRALARSGTAHLYLTAPDFGDGDLRLSGLLIGLPSAPKTTAMGLPSLEGIVPFQPTTARTFTWSDTIRLLARAYWKSDDESASATIEIVGGESTTRTVPLPGRALANGRREATLDVPLALQGLADGDYVLRVSAALPGEKAVVREIPFTIGARGAASR